MKEVELNIELGDKSSGVAMTQGPSGYLPEFTFSEDKPCDIPDEGTLTIEYRLIRHSTDTKDEDRPLYTYTVEVKKLLTAVAEYDDAPSKRDRSADDALDALAKEKIEEREEY